MRSCYFAKFQFCPKPISNGDRGEDGLMVQLKINGQSTRLDVDPETPLLWAVREQTGLTGTKFGCGIALCGACTMHVDGVPVRSCSTPLSEVEGAEVTTIEGIKNADGTLHAVQEAWIAHQVPQCGYCQSCLLYTSPSPRDQRGSRMPSSA